MWISLEKTPKIPAKGKKTIPPLLILRWFSFLRVGCEMDM